MAGRRDETFKVWLDQGKGYGRSVGYDPRCSATVFADMLPMGRAEVRDEGVWLDDAGAHTLAVGLVGAVEVQVSITEAQRAQHEAESDADDCREQMRYYRDVVKRMAETLREVHPEAKVDDDPPTVEEMSEAIEAALKLALGNLA